MSVSSTKSREPYGRVNSQQNGNRSASLLNRPRRRSIDIHDAYLYALRVAYLAYLLQPRAKRMSKPLPRPGLPRSSTSASFHDLMKDFSLVRDSKSTRYPHDFIKALEKRLQDILIGREKRPEYQDAVVKRSFAVFLNALSEPSFKRSVEKDRRAEDLVLIFFSNATKELQKGKPPGDEGVKKLVDRHVALFVRLLGLIMKDKDWAKDKPDLVNKLQMLETKLIKHDEDLTSPTVSDPTMVEEEVPLSYDVKDMPLVQIVARVFGLRNTNAQSDIDKHKSVWTGKAALQDLKTYQAHLNIGTGKTLNHDDFDTQEAYDEWKKSEGPQLSQMMLAVIGTHPDLAKSTPGGSLPDFSANNRNGDGNYSDTSKFSSQSESSSYVLDLPADLNALNLEEQTNNQEAMETIYTFIPPDPRLMFRYIMKQAMIQDSNEAIAEGSDTSSSTRLLSKQSIELLNEIAMRWRIPMFSRVVLFIDIVKERFVADDLSLDKLDAAFYYVKEPVDDSKGKKLSFITSNVLLDQHKWTIADFIMMQQALSAIADALLRVLYEAMMTCYDTKQSPLLGSILTVFDEHIESDPSFIQPTELLENFKIQVGKGLDGRAREIYTEVVEKELPQEQEKWEFYHIIQLSKGVLKLCERIQKRFRKNPEIKGVNLLIILLNAVLPSFAEDSRAIVEIVINRAKETEQDVPIQDGFELYQELSNFRRVHAEALPTVQFPYKLEDLLQDFVWRWIQSTESQVVGWVENAIRHDKFQTRKGEQAHMASEEERHSVSVIDVFRSFNQIVEQVAALEWDDDLGYAKFMTTLSKSIGKGVARYCDLLDQMFSKEMDRLTPEQEAAAKQTRQEKWVQLARDTWNQKEKVEPFNFYPESFVKLNDISFAISQWDKLEQEVNVDGCAAVMKRNEPPPQQRQQRKYAHFVFTIKIVEAEDLKAMDVNGFSDPYIVLTDEYQKRLFKSRIVYRNLNPRFDESVDIMTNGPLNVIATVWDWDALGDHDYVGRTSLKLDPSHFADFLPREYWLDLDTQGRLLVRVSMEGERDDIEFYFAKAFRQLQRTQRDMTRKITDKLSAYINHALSRRALRALLSKGMTISNFSNYLSRNRASVAPTSTAATNEEIMNAIRPLFNYFDDNFAIMNQTLTSDAMLAVMTRLWKEVLVTIETLLVPPLSDKPSQQKQLTQQELDVVFKWLQALFDFFHAVDEETGDANGVPLNVLKSPKYHEIQTLNFFYFEPTENLIRTSERIASASASQGAQRTRLSAPASLGQSFGGGLLAAGSAIPGTRRAKSIMQSRNLGTMKRAKEEKWKQAQAEPNDDMILRILRMRPEATGYLRDRSRQKERLAAAAAAEMIVRQSLAAGGGRMTGPSVVRR